MTRNIILIASAVLAAFFGQPAIAAKVGDPCTPKGGGAGHFVKTHITIKCQADATVRDNVPASAINVRDTDSSAQPAIPEKSPRLSGSISFPILAIEERITPMKIRFGNVVEDTGEIVTLLDTGRGRPATLTLNFDTSEIVLRYDLVVNADLLGRHSKEPIRLSVSETGPLAFAPPRPRPTERARPMYVAFVQLATVSTGTLNQEPVRGAIFKQRKGYGPGHPWMPACGANCH